MGGGCSTKKSIAINDAGAKVALDQLNEESKDDAGNQNALANKKNKSKLCLETHESILRSIRG